MGHQMLALHTRDLVEGVHPGGIHVQHTGVVQQRGSGQRHAITFAQATFQPQKNGHHHHLQAVLEKAWPLVAHDGEFEGNRIGQRHGAQRRQQLACRTQGLRQHLGQDALFGQILPGCNQRRHIHRILDREVPIDGFAQLVLHQPVVKAAVDAGPFFHQLDAVVGIDGVLGYYRTPVGHVGERTQVVRAVRGSGRQEWICHAENSKGTAVNIRPWTADFTGKRPACAGPS